MDGQRTELPTQEARVTAARTGSQLPVTGNTSTWPGSPAVMVT